MSDQKPEDKTQPDAAPAVSYRLATEADFPIIKEYYTLLNEHFYSFGYRLPHPENVGDVYLDSFRRTLGKFSNAWVAIDTSSDTPLPM